MPTSANADQLYDVLIEKLSSPAFAPRKLFEHFNIQVLCTTDAATDDLLANQAIHASGWPGRILADLSPGCAAISRCTGLETGCGEIERGQWNHRV